MARGECKVLNVSSPGGTSPGFDLTGDPGVQHPSRGIVTEDAVKKWILRQLGEPVVDVELVDAHLNDALDEAKLQFGMLMGQRRLFQIDVNTNKTEYQLPTDIYQVIEVVLPASFFDTLTDTEDQFSLAYHFLFGQWLNTPLQHIGGAGSSYGTSGSYRNQYPYSDLLQRLQYLETIERIWGADRDWEYVQETHTLRIMPPPQPSGKAHIIGHSHLIDVEAFVDPTDIWLFRQWSLAEAMTILGNMRSTIDSWPMGGGDKALNGDRLLDRALEIKADLTERFKELRKKAGPGGATILTG